MNESQRKELRAVDTSDFMACVKDYSNMDAFYPTGVEREEENDDGDDDDDMHHPEEDTRRYHLRQHKQSQKMKEGQKQIMELQKKEREEKEEKKHKENEFCSLFRECKCNDFSFLLNTNLSKKQQQCKARLYSHFGIKEETPSNGSEVFFML